MLNLIIIKSNQIKEWSEIKRKEDTDSDGPVCSIEI
jgi:hypothetical protein